MFPFLYPTLNLKKCNPPPPPLWWNHLLISDANSPGGKSVKVLSFLISLIKLLEKKFKLFCFLSIFLQNFVDYFNGFL